MNAPHAVIRVVLIEERGPEDSEPLLEPWYPLLSPQERDRAARFRSPGDAWAFAAGRALLRTRLSAMVGAPDPARLLLRTGEHGKPQLPDHPELSFNLSHTVVARRGTGEWHALVAFAAEDPAASPVPSRIPGALGIDVEQSGRGRDGTAGGTDLLALARRYFAPGEQALLAAVAPGERGGCFARIWTAKEAFLKATGEGLSRPLDSVEVDPGPPPSFVRIDGEEVGAWSLLDLPVPEGFQGALVVRGPGAVVRMERPDPRTPGLWLPVA